MQVHEIIVVGIIGSLLAAWVPWLIAIRRYHAAVPDAGKWLQFKLVGDYFRGRLDDRTRLWMHVYVALMLIFLTFLVLFPFSSVIARAP